MRGFWRHARHARHAQRGATLQFAQAATEIRKSQPRDLDELAQRFNDYRVFYDLSSDAALAKRYVANRMSA
jgi:hypothetical protein